MNMQPLDAAQEETLERAVAIQGRSLWIDARARLLKNRAAVVGMVILAIITLLAIFAPLLSPYPFDKVNFNLVSCSPDWWPDKMVLCNAGGAHWFGTDALGRDLFVRVLYGARVSLAVGLASTLVSLVIGVAYGAIAIRSPISFL